MKNFDPGLSWCFPLYVVSNRNFRKKTPEKIVFFSFQKTTPTYNQLNTSLMKVKTSIFKQCEFPKVKYSHSVNLTLENQKPYFFFW